MELTRREIDEFSKLCVESILIDVRNGKFKTGEDNPIEVFDAMIGDSYTDEEKDEMFNCLAKRFGKRDIFKLCGLVNSTNSSLKENSEAWNEYMKVLTECKELKEELKITSSLDLSNFLTLIMRDGFFSSTGKHRYQILHRKNLDGFYSMDIFRGFGVCLNFSQLLNDYLKTCGVESSIMVTKYTSLNLGNNPTGNFSSLVQKLSIPNHAITLINDENGLYYYDDTNCCVFNIVSPLIAKGVTINGSIVAYPSKSIEYFSAANSAKLLAKLFQKEKVREISKEEFKQSLEYVRDLIGNNKSLINDARESISASVTAIASKYQKSKK